MTKDISKATPENLVKTSAEGSVELSETELSQVTGGDKNKTTTTTKSDKQTYMKYELENVLISSY